MGQRHSQTGDELTVDEAIRRLEADADVVAAVARAAFDHAGELATLEYGRSAAVLGAVRLAGRRTNDRPLESACLESLFDVDPDRVTAAEELLASHLSPPAAESEIRSLRRRLVVAHELLAAAERGSVAGPELPGSYLADAAPILLARATDPNECRDDLEQRGLDEAALRAHVERLEADLEFARLGTTLDALVARDE
ncbi:hypothetical protein GS429_01830 [Natronorubrum sp. JWXQ-INN-674]|uniref:Uncharacterized protein n=1 Tax=Natronorubrum halalkaliphilum TaxID=2691917 RepID=A0A6B0VJR0_9EURY|nr:hypothetical protein [Natronorubrum halalkaliphilum]MXV60829.1 hypothetical protein [Natronorubrum halalkaliphilum]